MKSFEEPSSNPGERLKQLRSIKAAYDALTPSNPTLPSSDSLLPALLAARSLNQTITKIRTDIDSDEIKLQELLQRQQKTSRDVRDGELLRESLQKRIDRLQAQQAAASQKSPAEVAQERIEAQKRKKQGYEDETTRIGEALNAFIDQHLAAMLAAEELGGPVVGDMPDVDDDTLAAGFSQQGKSRRVGGTKTDAQEDKRQRRLDEIWGHAGTSNEEEERNERTAAGTEVQELVGLLWEALLGASNTGEYVTLERDSAAARFLVRSRVAQFHTRDARRLRLIDFGRELDN